MTGSDGSRWNEPAGGAASGLIHQSVSRASASRCLSRILAAKRFQRTQSLRRMLEYLVRAVLEGRDDELKEYTLGVEVFDRGADFDPRIDPIVRVQAAKLRKRLEEYYRDEGADDLIRIELARGGYIPAVVQIEQPPPSSGGLLDRPQAKVAVLPMLNLTGDPESEYLCSGLAEQLISLLGRIPGLRVVARTSSFAVAARNLDIREIGSRLGVQFVLEGSLRRRGASLLITVRLTDTQTGLQMWDRQFEGSLETFPELEAWTGQQVIQSVLSSVAGDFSLPAPAPAAESFDLTLRAWHHWRQASADSFRRALYLLAAAVEADPANYRAQAGYSTLCATMATFGLMAADDAHARAEPAVRAAIAAGSGASEPWEARGTFECLLEWSFEEGVSSYKKALELNPSNAIAQHGLGINGYLPTGRLDSAVTAMRKAVVLDPLSPFAAADLTYALIYAERYDEALEQSRRVAGLDPASDRARYDSAWCLTLAGRVDEALEIFEADPPMPDQLYPTGFHAFALARAGLRYAAEARLESLRRSCMHGEFATEVAAMTLLELGRREEALTELEGLVRRRDPQMRYLAVEPHFRQLRGEPRFEALLRQVGLG